MQINFACLCVDPCLCIFHQGISGIQGEKYDGVFCVLNSILKNDSRSKEILAGGISLPHHR